MNPPLQVDLPRLAIGTLPLIEGLRARIAPGTCLVVMGPSGSGKSSLLAWMAGTLDPAFHAQGRLHLGDERIDGLPPERRRLGLLFQDDLLFPHLSVGGNLGFALPAGVQPRRERRRRIDAALSEAGLAGMADRDPATLSGGQRARVALLRTLLAEPRALLLDEPFGKLDTALRQAFRQWVFQHARDAALPVVLVTHDHADAEAALQQLGGQRLDLGGA